MILKFYFNIPYFKLMVVHIDFYLVVENAAAKYYFSEVVEILKYSYQSS